MPVAEDAPSKHRNSHTAWTLTTNGHTGAGRALYAFLWVLCRTLSLVFFGFRSKFAEPLPSEGGLLVLASHQSHLDPLLLGLASPRRLSSLARSSLFKNRFLGELISLLDAVPIDRESSSIGAMKAIISRLKAGTAVIIFPEGTRTAKGEQLNDFQRGAANIALRAGVPIRPVLISCTPSTLTKNEKWYHIPEQPFHIHVKVLDAIRVEDVLDDVTVNPKNVRQLNQQLQWFFNQELSLNEQPC